MITQIIRFSSGSLFVIFKNTVRIRLRFGKNSIKPVYKTPVRVWFDSLVKATEISFATFLPIIYLVVITFTVEFLLEITIK